MLNLSESENEKEVSVIVVNFSSANRLARLMRDLMRDEYLRRKGEIIIVNQDAHEERIVRNIGEKIGSKVFSQENKGFGYGANRGAREAKGRMLFFINPDMRVAQSKFDGVEKIFAEKKEVGVIGAGIFSKEGVEDRESYGEKKRILQGVRDRVFQRKKIDEGRLSWVSGGAMFIRREDFKRIGGFDPEFFLYFEDVDLCLRMQQEKKTIQREASFQVLHWGGKSFTSKAEQKKRYYDAQEVYLEKHFGRRIRIVFSLLRLFSGKKYA